MSKHCVIMKRMKDNYESRSRTYLTRRTPVIIRLDGKAFHTYTRGLKKPFDEGLIQDMTDTAIYLCKNIQGAKCGYVQSDEISILVTDYDTLQTDAWFNYEVQKMTSISASLATGIFNKLRVNRELTDKWDEDKHTLDELLDEVVFKYTLANFDSRVFNIPKEEVSNYFLARQKDAVKNSVAMLAQSLYSPKELHGVNESQMQELTFQKGHNWNDLHWSKKRGSFIVKNTYWNSELTYEQNLYDDMCDPTIETRTDSLVLTDGGKYLDMDGKEVSDVVVRSRWESVETPFKFIESDFRKWV